MKIKDCWKFWIFKIATKHMNKIFNNIKIFSNKMLFWAHDIQLLKINQSILFQIIRASFNYLNNNKMKIIIYLIVIICQYN